MGSELSSEEFSGYEAPGPLAYHQILFRLRSPVSLLMGTKASTLGPIIATNSTVPKPSKKLDQPRSTTRKLVVCPLRVYWW